MGTLVTHKLISPEYGICAIALDRNHASLSLKATTSSGNSLDGISSLFTRLQELHIQTDMMMLLAREDEPTQELALTVDRQSLPRVRSIIESLRTTLGDPHVSVDTASARISVIGRHLTSRSDIVAGVFDTLHSASIPVQLVATTDMRITVLLPEKNASEAVKLFN